MGSWIRKPSDPHAVPSVFPTFLLPSIPFRRKSRQSSSDSTGSNSSTFSTESNVSTTSSSSPFPASSTPAPVFPIDEEIVPPSDKFLSGHSSHMHCIKCSTDLCLTSQIISKGFTGRHGRAYLVQGTPSHITSNSSSGQLPNTYQNKAVPRNLVTGQHTVSDISCAICGSVLGWKYVEASEESQKYKVGKFILETKRIRIGVSWENGDNEGLALPPNKFGGPSRAEAEMGFDSQDEDECEDLFAGVWSPQLATKRRMRKSLKFGGRGREGVIRGGGIRARSEEMLS